MPTTATPVRRLRFPPWWLAAALAGLLLAPGLPAAPEMLGAAWQEHRQQVLALLAGHPLAAPVVLFLLHTLLAALALPGASLLMLVAGAAYGAWAGTLLCLAGCSVGATLTMLASRHLLRPRVLRRFGPRLGQLDRQLGDRGPAYLFGLRLLPVVPFALVNLAAGLTTMGAWTFTWVSAAGMLAGTFVYVQAGASLARLDTPSDLLAPEMLLALGCLLVLPGLVAWRRHRACRA
jgi:uncharacterized membrane protein YdjX (TVP38/TMEM64 family)